MSSKSCSNPMFSSRFRTNNCLSQGVKLLFGFSLCLLLFAHCGPSGPTPCKQDSECGSNQACQSGTCINKIEPETCKSSADCGPGKICEGGQCKKGGCEDKSTRPCYDGPDGTGDKGECKVGTQTCIDGIWDVCKGQVVPQEETCNRKDDDCNGQVDEGKDCRCNTGDEQECYAGPPDTAGVGVCQKGVRYCDKEGKWGECLRESLPYAETCDGKDNDCNGFTDEAFPGKGDPCPTGKFGNCGRGAKTCENGKIVCGESNKPVKEICDNQDNDCDGQIDEDGVCAKCDEGKERSCYSGSQGTEGKGICKAGRSKCVNGAWGPCIGQVLPSAEKCDDKADNNCNGQVDEGCVACKQDATRPCYSGKAGCVKLSETRYSCFAPCKAGTQTCLGGKWGACQNEVNPKTETCDGQDNNCDGTIDEGCGCKSGEQRFCYGGPSQTRGQGECKAGVQACDGQGKWGPCQGEVQPAPETCNGKDDDCDGSIDGFSRLCYDGPPNTEKRGECRAGAEVCNNGSWSACQGVRKPQVETCDGLDNDCDGAIDGFSRPCFSGTSGCKDDGKGGFTCEGTCRAGFQQCSAGQWTKCAGDVTPKTETCNQQDDDCNGKVDDNCSP
ncbi:MAG: hypothetical protein EP343_11060 [Deltaproteobacteria bacterium]|nr:MAG: hypothetical protein EP343_11060 [Deltaproteobacteria bacterium]